MADKISDRRQSATNVSWYSIRPISCWDSIRDKDHGKASYVAVLSH